MLSFRDIKLLVCLVGILAGTMPSAPATAGSFWYGGVSDGPFYIDGSDIGYSDITFWWSTSKADDYDMYKFCWRKKSNTSKGDDPCLYNQIDTTDDTVQFSAIDKTILVYTTYKFRIRARKEKNGNWTTLTSTIINPCFWAGGGGPDSLRLSCTSNPSE